jgi:hypothetical protein
LIATKNVCGTHSTRKKERKKVRKHKTKKNSAIRHPGTTFLLFDDDEDILMILHDLLSTEVGKIIIAPSGTEAAAIARRIPAGGSQALFFNSRSDLKHR